MKRLILNALCIVASICCGLSANAAVVNVNGISVNTTPVWTTTFANPTYGAQKASVHPNGYTYVLGGNSTANQVSGYVGYYMINGTTNNLYSTGLKTAGYANAFDDAGNYVFQAAGTAGPSQAYNTAPTKFAVRTVVDGGRLNQNYYSYIVPSGTMPAVKFIDVTGDVTSASGGYVWFVPGVTSNSTELKIYAQKVANLKPTTDQGASYTATQIEISTGMKFTSSAELETKAASENYLQFYDTSNLSALKALLVVQTSGMFDVTIDVNNKRISAWKRITDSNANYLSTGAHIFMLNGKKVLVRNTRLNSSNQSTQFELLDITNGVVSPVKIATIQPTYGTVSAGSTNIGSQIHSVKVSDTQVDIYAYAPGAGLAKYTISYVMMDPLENVKGVVEVNTTDAPNRQDAVFTWTKPTEYTPTGYKITAAATYVNSANETVTDNYDYGTITASEIESDTEFKCRVQNLRWVYSSKVVENRKWCPYTYVFSITPVLSGGSLGSTSTVTLTPEFLPVAPVWTAILEYDGYQKNQIYWSAPGYGQDPNFYNVYRDGVKINEGPISNYNFLDAHVPVGDHSYYIEACYIGKTETAENSPRTVTVGKRNPNKTTYTVEEIYNYMIGTGSGQVNPRGICDNLSAKLQYKQGVYYKGKWYIMQQYTTDYKTSGVVVFDASKNGILSSTPTYATSWANPVGSGRSVGVAMDDGGNIFVRQYGSQSATGPVLVTTPEVATRLSYYFELGAGAIYLRNADGSYNQTPITVDLTQCQIYDTYDTLDPLHSVYYGRVEYFNMTGDLSKVGGEAYLWVSSSAMKRCNKIKLTRTATSTITATLIDKVDITLKDRLTGADFETNNENYVFPVKYLKKTQTGTDGYGNPVYSYSEQWRDDFIFNLRSRVYANINPTNNPNDLTDVQRTIYDTKGRVNNAGGCTIGFNDEIFLITPQCTYSQNMGNFYISMGDRVKYDANGDAEVDEMQQPIMQDALYADLTKHIPVAQVTQEELEDNQYSDANGNWIYAVLGKVDGEAELGINFSDPGEADCVYIYQYIPGVRFAKYRLLPNNYFPPTPVDLQIKSNCQETTNNPSGDLKSYDGAAVFGVAINGETTSSGNVNYRVKDYTYTFKNEAGTDVWTYTISPNGDYSYTRNLNGSTSTGSGSGIYSAEVYEDVDGVERNGCFRLSHPDLVRGDIYESAVSVNYVNVLDEGDMHESEKTTDRDIRDYDPKALAVQVSVAHRDMMSEDGFDGVWDNQGVPVDVYRVEININHDETTEPVSYYAISATTSGNARAVVPVENFDLMVDGQPTSGGLYDVVPGDYDFANNEAKFEEASAHASTALWYHIVDDGTYTNGVNDPSTWKYTVTAVYASEATAASKLSETVSATVEAGSIITGIEDAMSGGLKVYPVPVETMLNVESPVALENVVIFNEAGVAVKSISCNGEFMIAINADDLASGHYIVVVNNQTPIKFIKK